MIDKETILQVLCGLMQNPTYLSQTDKYLLNLTDFSTVFEKYIFSAIYNLYQDGAKRITVVDIDNYFNSHPAAKAVFEKENGIEYLQDALDFSEPDNFPFYYKRLKKFNCLRDLKKDGIDISRFYCEDLTNPKAKEINERFEKLDVSDIFSLVRNKLTKLETDYSVGDASETNAANKNIRELVEQLKQKPEIGARLQGDIFNTICRGARETKFYIRSASSGTGKTRAAIGDACKLSYPIRFNTLNWEWEYNGASEKTLFIATEQELEEIQTLVLAYITGFNEEKILYGKYNEEELRVVEQALYLMDIYKDNLLIVRLSNPSVEQIKGVVRQNWLLYGIKNVFYDYIFSSPSLLNEFRDLKIREDVALNLLSTALKDLAVEMKLFIMSSTQTNAKSEDNDKGIKNESVIRGSRSIIDKCDIGCVISRVSKDEEELLSSAIEKIGVIPNQVLDVYKVRRGRYTNVRIWSQVDLGTCRKEDLFITDEKYNLIEGFKVIDFLFDEKDSPEILKLIKDLNSEHLESTEEVKKVQKIDVEEILQKQEENGKGLFGGLL